MFPRKTWLSGSKVLKRLGLRYLADLDILPLQGPKNARRIRSYAFRPRYTHIHNDETGVGETAYRCGFPGFDVHCFGIDREVLEGF